MNHVYPTTNQGPSMQNGNCCVPDFCAAVAMQQIRRTFRCDGTVMLTLAIDYPTVTLPGNSAAQCAINRRILTEVREFYQTAEQNVFCQAVEAYRESQKNGFPFFPYDAVLVYQVPYNQNCHLSVYHDAYTYTGGAHGSTVRSSKTWTLADGCPRTLASFFAPGSDWRGMLIAEMRKQAAARLQQDPGIFFEDYAQRISDAFDANSFYLTPNGLVIYYQQYDIAPYSTGIVEFTIPWCMVDMPPECRGM